jgi:hypothetical protein
VGASEYAGAEDSTGAASEEEAAEYAGAEDSTEDSTGAASEELGLATSVEEAAPGVTVTVFWTVVVTVTSLVQEEVASA